jgi:DNA polymerase-3 subunit epsilon
MERYVVIDVETTGFNPGPDRVVEVALVVVERGQCVGAFQSLVNPGIPTKAGARAVNGITDAMLADAPLPADVWPQVIEMIGDSPLVAHNAPFDRGFLCHELYLLNHPPLKHKWLCTMQRGQALLGYRPRLGDLVRKVCGVAPVGLHRAMADVEALVGVAQHFWPYKEPAAPVSAAVDAVLGDFNKTVDKPARD